MKYGNRSGFKKSFRRFANSPFMVVAALVLCFFLAKAAWGVHDKVKRTEARLLQAQAELAKLEERKVALSAKVTLLSTEEGVEAEMRTKYRAVKEGEKVAVIVDDKNAAAVADASTISIDEDVGWWKKVLQWVGIGR